MKHKQTAIVKTIFTIMIIMVNIGCDQVSKHIVREKIYNNQNIYLMYNHFNLTNVENTGAFLSLGDNIAAPLKFILLTLLPLVILGLGLIYLIVKKNIAKLPLMAACFIIGGGIGNIYDRLIYHSVTDFMHVRFGKFQTGIFNMADVSVIMGVFILFFYVYVKHKKNRIAEVADV